MSRRFVRRSFTPSYDADTLAEYEAAVREGGKRLDHVQVSGGRAKIRGVEGPVQPMLAATKTRLSRMQPPWDARTQSSAAHELALARAASAAGAAKKGVLEDQIRAGLDAFRGGSDGILVPAGPGPLVAAGVPQRAANILVRRASGRYFAAVGFKDIQKTISSAREIPFRERVRAGLNNDSIFMRDARLVIEMKGTRRGAELMSVMSDTGKELMTGVVVTHLFSTYLRQIKADKLSGKREVDYIPDDDDPTFIESFLRRLEQRAEGARSITFVLKDSAGGSPILRQVSLTSDPGEHSESSDTSDIRSRMRYKNLRGVSYAELPAVLAGLSRHGTHARKNGAGKDLSVDPALTELVASELASGRFVPVPSRPGYVYWPIRTPGRGGGYVGVKVTSEKRARVWAAVSSKGAATRIGGSMPARNNPVVAPPSPAHRFPIRIGYGTYLVFSENWWGSGDPLYALLSRRGNSVDWVTVFASAKELDRMEEVANSLLFGGDAREKRVAAPVLHDIQIARSGGLSAASAEANPSSRSNPMGVMSIKNSSKRGRRRRVCAWGLCQRLANADHPACPMHRAAFDAAEEAAEDRDWNYYEAMRREAGDAPYENPARSNPMGVNDAFYRKQYQRGPFGAQSSIPTVRRNPSSESSMSKVHIAKNGTPYVVEVKNGRKRARFLSKSQAASMARKNGIARPNMAGRPGKHGLATIPAKDKKLQQLSGAELKALGTPAARAEIARRRSAAAMRATTPQPPGRAAKPKKIRAAQASRRPSQFEGFEEVDFSADFNNLAAKNPWFKHGLFLPDTTLSRSSLVPSERPIAPDHTVISSALEGGRYPGGAFSNPRRGRSRRNPDETPPGWEDSHLDFADMMSNVGRNRDASGRFLAAREAAADRREDFRDAVADRRALREAWKEARSYAAEQAADQQAAVVQEMNMRRVTSEGVKDYPKVMRRAVVLGSLAERYGQFGPMTTNGFQPTTRRNPRTGRFIKSKKR